MILPMRCFFGFFILFSILCTLETRGQSQESDSPKVFHYVEKMPEFKGGQQKLYEFLSNNIDYPAKAKRKCITGKVVVSFVITKDGGVDSVMIKHSVHPLLDSEAVRVIRRTHKKWTPGTQSGKPIAVNFLMPISFTSEDCPTESFYFNAGVKAFEKNDYSAALEKFERAYQINFNNLTALYNAALTNAKLGDLSKACEEMKILKEKKYQGGEEFIKKYCEQ